MVTDTCVEFSFAFTHLDSIINYCVADRNATKNRPDDRQNYNRMRE